MPCRLKLASANTHDPSLMRTFQISWPRSRWGGAGVSSIAGPQAAHSGMDKVAFVSHRSSSRLLRDRRRATLLKLQHRIGSFLKVKQAATFQSVRGQGSAASLYMDALSLILAMSNLKTAVFFEKWKRPPYASIAGRPRDPFPIPPIQTWPANIALKGLDATVCLDVCNMCLGALNFLNAGLKNAFLQVAVKEGLPTRAQVSAQQHVGRKVVRRLTRLSSVLADSLHKQGSFGKCEEAALPQYEEIRSDKVDLPDVAASCDPNRLISSELSAQIVNARSIFPNRICASPASVQPNKRSEYIKLTIRELACGKLRLCREVQWPSELSAMATAPPKPRRLANPSSFLDLQLEDGERILFSKCDASTFFDTLQVPEPLQTYLGQPAVSVNELLAHGMTRNAIIAACDGGFSDDDAMLHPVHAVWPMGFSWSSAVAQYTTLATCMAAGISEDNILSPEHDVPELQDELCLIATDDTVHKSYTGASGP